LVKGKKPGRGPIMHLAKILEKSAFLTNIQALTPVEIHWLLSKFVGTRIAIRLISRIVLLPN